MPSKPRKEYKKAPELNTRIGKYFIAKRQGKNKKEAQALAGFVGETNGQRIEKTKTYQALEQAHYKDELLKKISLSMIADEQIKVIMQDKDLGAKNSAIKEAIAKIEPDKITEDDSDKVLVILRE